MAAGRVSRRQLQSRYRPVYRNSYLAKDAVLTPVTRAKAAWLWAGRRATLGGLSAAAVHGSRWIDATEPADLFRLGDAVDGINIHRDALAAEEVSSVPSFGWMPWPMRRVWRATKWSQ